MAPARWRSQPKQDFSRFNVEVSTPIYDEATYEQLLSNDPEWSKEETDYLIDVYRESNGKWPVISDRYTYSDRTMENLKSRYYTISAALMVHSLPISSMTKPEYDIYETLTSYEPTQDQSRKRLAASHLQRPQNEVDEEHVLLSELQRIMSSQTSLDAERENIRRRLDYPHASGGYQYTTSQALTGLWQNLIGKKQSHGPSRTKSSAGINMPDSARGENDTPASANHRSSLSHSQSHATPTADPRFGVSTHDTLPSSGVSFAGDRLTKPRTAKSTVLTEKIAMVLQHAGVPDLIPLPTPKVVEAFEGVMSQVHALLDLRKLREREEQEVRIREAEAGS